MHGAYAFPPYPYGGMPAMPSPFMQPGYGFPPYPMPMSTPMSASHTHQGMNSSGPASSPIRSSPPLPDVDDLTEWCRSIKVPPTLAEYLDNLGFTVGCNVNDLSKEDVTAAGFKPLQWSEFKKRYNKHLKELRH